MFSTFTTMQAYSKTSRPVLQGSNPRLDCFIFDWSGTLSDDFDMVYRATADVVAALDSGYKLSEEEYREHFELPYMKFYQNYGLHVTKKQVDDLFFQAVEKNGLFPTPLPDSRSVLDGLKKQNRSAFLFSAHPKHLVDREVAAFGYSGCFSGVEAGIVDKIVSLKGFVRKNKLNPEQTAYVGDLVHDVQAAKAAGVKSVVVFSRYQNREKLLDEKPDFVLKKLGDILTI